MTKTIRERAQAYLELAGKATEGPWKACITEVVSTATKRSIAKVIEADDERFIATSRTEGVWAAQKLLEALDENDALKRECALLSKYANFLKTIIRSGEHFDEERDNFWRWAQKYSEASRGDEDLAVQFLEGSER